MTIPYEEIDGARIAVVSLNRPAKLNGLTMAMLRGLDDAAKSLQRQILCYNKDAKEIYYDVDPVEEEPEPAAGSSSSAPAPAAAPAAPAAPPRSSAAPPATLSALHSARCSQRSLAVTVHFDHWQCTVPALLIQPSP